MNLLENRPLDVSEEREDVYRKLKDGFDFAASIVTDEKKNVIHRLRAVMALSEIAKTMCHYLLDEEKFSQLEKEVKELKKQYDERNR